MLPKSRIVGVTLSAAGLSPLPPSDAAVLPPGVPETASEADRRPVAVGAKRAWSVQVAPDASGAPLQPSELTTNMAASDPLSAAVRLPVGPPPVFLTVNVTSLPACPTTTGPKSFDVGEMVSAPGVSPLPVSVTTALPPGFPDTVSVADLAPVDAGEKCTLTVQLPLAATIVPSQLSLVTAKDPASMPPSVVASVPVALPPVFDTCSVTSLLLVPTTTAPKSLLVGEKTSAPGVAPRPVSSEIAAPPVVACTVMDAALAPLVCGAKWTCSVQLPPAGSVAPEQLSLVMANSPTSLPVSVVASVLVTSVPVFVTVKVTSLDVAPSTTVPKSSSGGALDRAPGASPAPASGTAMLPPGIPPMVKVPLSAPTVVGPNSTVMVQLADASNMWPTQSLALTVKSPLPERSVASGPEVAVPPFVTVRTSGVLVVPVSAFPKS